MSNTKMSNTAVAYFFGYDGKVLTKEEYDRRVAEAKAEREKAQTESANEEYDW